MKKTMLFISVILLSTLAFAGFTKDSPQLKALGSAWKTQASTNTQKDNIRNHQDIMIVYGGQDITETAGLATLTVA